MTDSESDAERSTDAEPRPIPDDAGPRPEPETARAVVEGDEPTVVSPHGGREAERTVALAAADERPLSDDDLATALRGHVTGVQVTVAGLADAFTGGRDPRDSELAAAVVEAEELLSLLRSVQA